MAAPWVRISARPEPGSRTLFLDRDGTIIENVDYLADPNQVSLISGAAETLRLFRAAGFAIVVVTNQSGVARGLISPAQYRSVADRVDELLGPGLIDASYACPFHPDGRGEYAVAHAWRKPAGGMMVAAAQELGLDLTGSVLIGDSLSDIMAAADAGVRRAVHVLTGHGPKERASVEQWAGERPENSVLRVDSIANVVPGDVR